MKQIKALQYLVYVAFALFILQDVAKYAWRGFKEGYEDGSYAAQNGNLQRGPLVIATLNGDVLTHNHGDGLQISPGFDLQNITINTDIRLSPQANTTPWWLHVIKFAVAAGVTAVLVIIAISINQIIKKITENTMFDDACIRLIRKTASLLLLYTIGDYLYQRVDYLMDSRLLPAKLQVLDTSAFNYQALICAILVFIIAEAFKQGYRLKQEQDLTI